VALVDSLKREHLNVVPAPSRRPRGGLLVAILLLTSGCANVGPNYVRPDLSVSPGWSEAEGAPFTNELTDCRDWWRQFNDPVLDNLINTADRQNLSLRIAGVRVLEARAQLGIATGSAYPQVQQVFGSLQYNRLSDHSALSPAAGTAYEIGELGLRASWEIDFWGKFRRAIESAGANLLATEADLDSALVTLTADIAGSYVLIRTLEKRMEIAQQNADTQKEVLGIAEARLRGGLTSARDVEQAKTSLNHTLASIPVLQAQVRQACNALSVLLGTTPTNPVDLIGSSTGIPVPPPRIAIGIPFDLVRRRPDIKSAEYRAMAQGAQIGVAKADLYPSFSLSGSFSFLSSNVGGSSVTDLFGWGSRTYVAGPGVQWNLFNYGRITNNVRVQDARFQELLIVYQNTVLIAQREVEDGLTGYLRSQEQARFLARSAEAAKASLDLALAQYQGGATDFTTVLTSQQALLNEQDNLASALGSVSGSLVAVYRALGGGWEVRGEDDLIPDEIKRMMAKRTNWGELLRPVRFVSPGEK
jgi:NodT family efflux transporter outer membrane factor (OMF) lipoprotein